jgi:hypothetical protein
MKYMKILFCLLAAFSILLPSFSAAEEFHEVPLFPDGRVMEETDTRLELQTDASHDAVLSYYKEILEGEGDILFRERSDATYIEDHGLRPWHSITISKTGTEGVSVVVVRDNWTWIGGMLLVRFIGVFAVLLILFLAMKFSGMFISNFIKSSQEKKAAG